MVFVFLHPRLYLGKNFFVQSLSAESTNDSESRKSPLSEETLVNGREGGKTSEEETGVSNDEAGSRLSKMSETRTDASAPYSDMTSTAKKSSSVLSSDSDLPEISVSAKKKSEFKRMRLKIEEMSSDDDFRVSSKLLFTSWLLQPQLFESEG